MDEDGELRVAGSGAENILHDVVGGGWRIYRQTFGAAFCRIVRPVMSV
jgi:hypothetical protein